MKREDILAMPAGRELDALVAEKVMGFPNVHKFYHRYVYDNVGSLGNVAGRIDVNEYSTDISAAWEVVEKMQDRGITLSHFGGVWKVSIHEGNGKTNDFLTDSVKTHQYGISEAICKAALLTVLEESL